MRTTAWLGALLAAASLGCGGDDGSAGTDSGVDAGGGGDAGAEASYLLSVRLIDPDEAPIEGVVAAVDSSAGRFEGESGPDGHLDIEFEAEAGEMVWVIFAKHGFTVRAEEFSVDDLSDERVDRTLGTVNTGDRDRVNVTVSTTGVPTGGRICTSFEGFHLCSPPGETDTTVPVIASGLGDTVHVFAIDDAETVVDFAAVPIPDGGDSRTVSVDFDGTLDATPTVRDVSVTLPESEDPLFSSFEPPVRWPGFFTAVGVDSRRMWGIATDVARDGSTLTLTYTEIPADEELQYASWISPDLMVRGTKSRNFYADDPGNSFEVLGVPVLLTGESITGAFEWSPPEGDFLFRLTLGNSAGAIHVAMWTPDTNATLPDFPSEFDRDAAESVFPFPGSPGEALVTAVPRAELENEGFTSHSISAQRTIDF